MRINKFLSQQGLYSRRQAEILIKQQRVMVNGETAIQGMQISSDDELCIDGKPLVSHSFEPKFWIYHKPCGVVTSMKCEKSRICVADVLKEKLQLDHFITVGRLDLNSEGLLLITNDGQWARKMMISDLVRIYRVRAFGAMSEHKASIMQAQLQQGIKIDGVQYAPITLEIQSNSSKNFWCTITLMEGKNREIRKVLKYFDVQVNRLIRLSYGPYCLGSLKSNEAKPTKNLTFATNLRDDFYTL